MASGMAELSPLLGHPIASITHSQNVVQSELGPDEGNLPIPFHISTRLMIA
jgi:hypothetical protein